MSMVLQRYLGIHTYTLNFLSPKPKPPGLGALRLRPRLTVSEDSKVIESSQSRHEYKVNALCFFVVEKVVQVFLLVGGWVACGLLKIEAVKELLTRIPHSRAPHIDFTHFKLGSLYPHYERAPAFYKNQVSPALGRSICFSAELWEECFAF